MGRLAGPGDLAARVCKDRQRLDAKGEQMPWYHYVECFFAGAFLANVVPHFVHGISGDRFPTPFAKPPGQGLSSAPVNMVWALVNMALGYGLFRFGGVWTYGAAALWLVLWGCCSDRAYAECPVSNEAYGVRVALHHG